MSILLSEERTVQEFRRVADNRRRARRTGQRADLRGHEWVRVLKRHGLRCAYCGGPYESIDHVIPLVNGGGTTVSNVVPACHPCNHEKGTAVWLSSPNTAVVVNLTDGDAVYDTRGISLADLGRLNARAQEETAGELWWEVRK